jgi:hypothetical protein
MRAWDETVSKLRERLRIKKKSLLERQVADPEAKIKELGML